jgi:hypothetical protein
MVTSVTKGGTQKLPNKFKIVETYWHDHSSESSWFHSFFDSTNFGGQMHFLKTSVLKELKRFGWYLVTSLHSCTKHQSSCLTTFELRVQIPFGPSYSPLAKFGGLDPLRSPVFSSVLSYTQVRWIQAQKVNYLFNKIKISTHIPL